MVRVLHFTIGNWPVYASGKMVRIGLVAFIEKGEMGVDEVRVVLIGLGAMGAGIGEVLARRRGIRIVGAVRANPAYHGRDLSEVLGLEEEMGVDISGDAGAVLAETDPDLCMISTFSFTREVKPQILQALDCGCDVITIAEEMAFPAAAEPEITEEIHQRAVERGKTVLGTGINPGFILDGLIIALTAACTDVRTIKARRVNDLSPFGPTVMRTQGVGTTLEEFERGLRDGTIVGHVGFVESMHMIAYALGWKLDRIEQERKPIMADEQRRGQHITVEAGMVAGCNHTARGYINDEPVIVLEHPQQVQPSAAGVDTGDYIDIDGVPQISLGIKPEIPGGIGTIALAVNMIGPVLAASPGLATMVDLPLPRAVLGDVRETVEALQKS